MKFFATILACAALANAGGIPSYSISELQPDRSIQITRGASWGAPLLSTKTLAAPLAYAEPAPLLSAAPLWSSKTIISEPAPALLSAPLLTKTLSAPAYISRAAPLLTSSTKILRSEPLISSWASPSLLKSAPLGLSSLYGLGLSAPLAEPTILAAPTKTIITRSQPIISSAYIRSEPLITKTLAAPTLLSAPLLSKSIISEPTLLTSDSLLGGKLWLKK